MKIPKQSYEMFYLLIFSSLAFWLNIHNPSIIFLNVWTILLFGAVIFVIRVYNREEREE